MKLKYAVLAAALFGLALLVSCVAGKAPTDQPDINFASITASAREENALILSLKTDFEAARKLGVPVERGKYLKVSVRVDKSTRIFRSTGLGGIKRAGPNDLLKAARFRPRGARPREHSYISMWFRKPFRKSNPPKGTAKIIFY